MYYLSVMYSYNVFIAYIGLYVCIAVTLIVLCLAMHPCIQWAAVGYDDEESMSLTTAGKSTADTEKTIYRKTIQNVAQRNENFVYILAFLNVLCCSLQPHVVMNMALK